MMTNLVEMLKCNPPSFSGSLIVIALVFSVNLADISSAYEGCTVRYGRRSCSHRSLLGVLATCNGAGTESRVPQNLPRDTVYLLLTNFNITRLDRTDFVHFASVECLAIIDSSVSEISYDAFAGMEKLSELTLDNSRFNESQIRFLTHPSFHVELLALTRTTAITMFPDHGATKSLNELKTLNLSGNALEAISAKIFPELQNIERLDFSGNRLHTLDWTMFTHMTKLNRLFLSGNRIQTIPDSMHSVFFAVKELTLAGNPLHCNCFLIWLKEFYDNALDQTLDTDNVFCFSPKLLAIKRASSAVENFRCIAPRLPVISWLESADGRVEMNCTSSGDPAPILTLTLPDERGLIVPAPERLSELMTSTPQILTSGGLVVCKAANSNGVIGTSRVVGSVVGSSRHNHHSESMIAMSLLLTTILHFAKI